MERCMMVEDRRMTAEEPMGRESAAASRAP